MSASDIQPEADEPRSRRSVFDATPAAVLVADPEEHCVYANQPALTLLGYSLAELAAIHMSNLHMAAPELLQAQAEQLKARRSWSGRLYLRPKQGDPVPVATNILVGPCLDGGEDCFVALIHPLAPGRAVPAQAAAPAAGEPGLADRDLQVLILCSEGFSDDEIAVLLDMNPSGVAEHIRAATRAMNTGSRTEACILALKTSLIV
jgi:PAS domain S-box-containing protein